MVYGLYGEAANDQVVERSGRFIGVGEHLRRCASRSA
jgi:hypothetical protein